MKSNLFFLFCCLCVGNLFAQNHLYFSFGGNFTSSTFPSFKVEGSPDLVTQGRLNMVSAVTYQRQIKPKFAVGLGLQATPRSFYVGVNKDSPTNFKGGGHKYLYGSLVPQIAHTPTKRWTLNLALPVSYLANIKSYNSFNGAWVKIPTAWKDTYNKIDFGLQPGIQFNFTERFALNLEAYYGIPSVNKDLQITDINGTELETVKDHNIGLSLSLKHRIF